MILIKFEEEEDENSPEFKKLKGKARIKIQYRFIKPSTQSNAAPMTPMTPASIPAFTEEPRIAPLDEEEDDEEEDEEAEKLKAQRLEEYRKKKEGKVKPAAKSMVTLDVKPWGQSTFAGLVFARTLLTVYLR